MAQKEADVAEVEICIVCGVDEADYPHVHANWDYPSSDEEEVSVSIFLFTSLSTKHFQGCHKCFGCLWTMSLLLRYTWPDLFV